VPVYGRAILRRVLPLVVLLTALSTAAPAAAQQSTGEGKTVAPVEGASFSGVVASYANFQCQPECTATIQWGDGSDPSSGTVALNGNARDVSGTHAYAEEGTYTIDVVISDGQRATSKASGTANVADAPLTATGTTFTFSVGDTYNGLVAHFTDADPAAAVADYTVKIDWGDGSAASAGSVIDNPAGGLDATGSHTYSTPGQKTVTVTITDAGGASASADSTASVGAGSGPPPATKPAIVASLAGNGGPNVRVFALDGSLLNSFFAFDSAFNGGVRVASADLNGDKTADIITAAGPGGGPHVKVFNGVQGNLLSSFDAFDPSFGGGVYVAVGDVNGDGVPDIVAGAGAGGGPQVKVFNGVQGNLLNSFFAFDPSFKGGVTVAAGDVNGDGFADIITGAGPGGGPHVKIFNGVQGNLLQSFFAFDPSFAGGVNVAAGDVNGDGRADVVTGAGPGGGPQVKVFSAGVQGNLLHSFFAFDPSFNGGVNVAAGDVNGDGRPDVVAGAGPGGGPHVRAFSGVDGSPLAAFDAFAPSTSGGVFVAVGAGFVPAVQRFTLTRTVFRVASFSTPVRAAVGRGTVFRFVLNGPGKVKITIARKVGKHFVKRGVLRRRGKRGLNSVRFSGRIGRRALKPGRYRAIISTGPKALPRKVLFKIVAG
jgi:hypothetical protein